jgi:glycerophosphoryl diester phosphodiesterase
MRPFEVHGHRGVPSLLPENTLEGFELAIALGATALELDVTLSADGVVIVSHEPIADAHMYRLRETSDAPSASRAGGVLGHAWSRLSMVHIGSLDAGSPGWLGAGADPFEGTRRSVPGARVPTLDAVFRLARRLEAQHLRFEIEAKSDPTGRIASADALALARSIGAVVRRHGMVRRSRLRSFDWRVLAASRRWTPGLATVALIRADTATSGSSWMQHVSFRRGRWATNVTSAARDLGTLAVAPADALVDVELMAASRRAGPAVLPWTVNSVERARELMALGASGLTTDHPGVVGRLVDSMGAPQRSPGSSR